MTLAADLFFSFRSPYSYLAIGRYREMVREYDLEIKLRAVWPIAIRDPDILFTGNPAAPRYILMDAYRVAQMRGIPFRWPRPDPIVQDPEMHRVAEEQPYIRRLVRLGQAAARRGRGLDFACEVSTLIFSGEVDDWHTGDHLANTAARAGLNLAELDAEAESDAEALDGEIEENQRALEAAGHWGVPTLVFEGEPFFGQDRIDVARWRMEQKGLAKHGD
ncbi:2-hydroxychromene-2-carboxylate isomerase [Erythrobacter sp.]|jgi:2-hydroxychromene-2-carboxylate isomerase|uniref:2-hydroxychromene-2-carboxylate isomerase n=1 Tax=Erythrobacter sp. TaxID=1042 RepID=UPI002EACEE17|nr:DsbA family protein [Erythrobacter sp.]